MVASDSVFEYLSNTSFINSFSFTKTAMKIMEYKGQFLNTLASFNLDKLWAEYDPKYKDVQIALGPSNVCKSH